MKKIEFWLSIGSTYTYLSVTRILDVEKKHQVKFSWKPFSVRKIMKEMDNVPFPPNKLVPPRTAAAITDSSSPSPNWNLPVCNLPAYNIPAREAIKEEIISTKNFILLVFIPL